jgi:hypothetical protein
MRNKGRKELIRLYRETPRPAGVYRVLHKPSGRALIGTAPDTRAKFNSLQAQLSFGSFPNKAIQADWDADGEDAFVFEVLDLLPPGDDPTADLNAELATLLEMWLEKLGLDEDLRY